MNEVQYEKMCDEAANAELTEKLVAAIQAQQDNRHNKGCWPVAAFGWKDADLDAEGCSGIRSIVAYYDQDEIAVEVGIHKTFCIDSDWTDEQVRRAQELLPLGYGYDTDPESWLAYTADTLRVAWIMRDAAPDYEATAAAILAAARAWAAPHEKTFADASNAQDSVGDTTPTD